MSTLLYNLLGRVPLSHSEDKTMTITKFVLKKSVLWMFVGLICLLVGCQVGLQGEVVTENINTPDKPTPATPFDKTGLTPTTLPFIQPSATATKQPTGTAMPIPTATATEDNFRMIQIYPQIALLCGEPGSYSAVCTFDTQANELEIIA